LEGAVVVAAVRTVMFVSMKEHRQRHVAILSISPNVVQ
jgi:hypothetical protein